MLCIFCGNTKSNIHAIIRTHWILIEGLISSLVAYLFNSLIFFKFYCFITFITSLLLTLNTFSTGVSPNVTGNRYKATSIILLINQNIKV